jgi:alpha-ketoglutaric semialdehyde dehydrogenase
LVLTSAAAVTYGNLIGGESRAVDATYDDRNPADERDVVGRFPLSGAAEAQAAVDAAAAALSGWAATPAIVRGRHLQALAAALREREGEIVEAVTREQGKPLAESRGEFGKSLEYLEYYAGAAWEYGGRLLPSSRVGVEMTLRREPVGVCALVTPWNVPIAIPLRKIAPALLAGNTVVVKPSSETPLSCHLIGEAAQAAGLPAGVVNVLHGRGGEAVRAVCSDPRVRAISFTGSTEVGRELAVLAAERLIKIQLELGGKNAAVILDDADLELAVESVVAAGYGGSGQQCTAASRIVVAESVREEFTGMLAERVRSLRVAAGTADGVQIGPLVSERQLRTVLDYVAVGVGEGAELLVGGERSSGAELAHGWFMQPTLLAGVRRDMRVAQEEIFGPVVAVIAAAGDDEALAIANDSVYGLSAAVYTRSLARAARFLDGLEAGAVAVNLPTAGWEVQIAFGGVKDSGGSGWKEQGAETLDFFSDLKATQVRAA